MNICSRIKGRVLKMLGIKKPESQSKIFEAFESFEEPKEIIDFKLRSFGFFHMRKEHITFNSRLHCQNIEVNTLMEIGRLTEATFKVPFVDEEGFEWDIQEVEERGACLVCHDLMAVEPLAKIIKPKNFAKFRRKNHYEAWYKEQSFKQSKLSTKQLRVIGWK